MEKGKIIGHRLRNVLHTLLLFASMIALLALLGLLIAGVHGLLWASVVGILILLLTPRFSPRLILRMYNAMPLSPQEAPALYHLVGELSHRAELSRVPHLYYVPSRMMSAFSVGTRREAVIGLTDGFLRNLNGRELTGVLAHEISHITKNDMRVMGVADVISRITTVFAVFGQMLLLLGLPLLLVGAVTVPWSIILLLIGGPTLSSLLQLALSRTREFGADLDAAHLTGDPAGLAAALQKLEYHKGSLLGRILMPGHSVPDPSLFRTHPKTSERVHRLLELAGEKRPQAVDERQPSPTFPDHISQITRRPHWRMTGLWF